MKSLASIVLSLTLMMLLQVREGRAQHDEKDPQVTHEAKVRELLVLNGTANIGGQIMEQMLVQMKQLFPETPHEVWQEFRAEADPEEMIDKLVPVYTKHFSETDVDGLIEFFGSPLGQKLVLKMPLVMQEASVLGEQWGLEIAKRAKANLEEKGYVFD